MLKRLAIAGLLAAATLGVGSAAHAYSESDPQCNGATTGIDGAGIWVNGVTGNTKCQSTFTDTNNPTGPGIKKSCDVYVVAIAYRCDA